MLHNQSLWVKLFTVLWLTRQPYITCTLPLFITDKLVEQSFRLSVFNLPMVFFVFQMDLFVFLQV